MTKKEMPNLLGEYDCGDEPEDDSVHSSYNGESAESEDPESVDSPSPIKDQPIKEEALDLEPDCTDHLNQDDNFSKQSTGITNNDHQKFLTSLGSGQGIPK